MGRRPLPRQRHSIACHSVERACEARASMHSTFDTAFAGFLFLRCTAILAAGGAIAPTLLHMRRPTPCGVPKLYRRSQQRAELANGCPADIEGDRVAETHGEIACRHVYATGPSVALALLVLCIFFAAAAQRFAARTARPSSTQSGYHYLPRFSHHQRGTKAEQ